MPVPGPIATFTRPLDGLAKILAVVAFAPLLLQWGFVLVFLWPRLGTLSYLRLHYTVARGVDWIDRWEMILVFPAIGLVSWMVNVALASRLARTSRHLAHVIMAVTIVAEMMFAVGGVFAVLLNG